LCDAYGLTQMGIEGLTPDSEPDPARMAEVIDFVKENKVKTIFFEDLVSPKVAETIAKETGAKTEVLYPLEGLTDEKLKNGDDYFSVMEKNLTVLKEALE
ncbi:zinc ABC transporter solute-binding protein, partial [Weissella cibaria]|uniref:metal ABC transporter solute-binding protein, Zn/Mn family n=1 Tax=Weissella cibaria TaxID=137591 RepID=UPI00143F5F41